MHDDPIRHNDTAVQRPSLEPGSGQYAARQPPAPYVLGHSRHSILKQVDTSSFTEDVVANVQLSRCTISENKIELSNMASGSPYQRPSSDEEISMGKPQLTQTISNAYTISPELFEKVRTSGPTACAGCFAQDHSPRLRDVLG